MEKLNANDAIALLKQLIATPSVSRDESNTASILHDFLLSHGIAAERISNNVWAKCKNYDNSKPTLLLNSHHDTVKPSAAYTRDPHCPTLEGDRLYGLGSNDAGASVVSLITTFCNLYDATLPFNLLLLIGAEEEVMGEHGMREMVPYFKEHDIKIDMALVGEPTDMQAAVGERGLVVLDCVAHGKQGHAARNEGINAIYKALQDIETLRNFHFEKTSSLLGDIKITTTQIEAGTQHNVVPDSCRFVVDIRTTDAYSNEEVVEIIRGAIEADATPRSTRVRASAISESHPLVATAIKLGAKAFVSPTTSDMALMPFPSLKLGPGQSMRSHSADEFVLVSEIEHAIVFYHQLLTNIEL